MDKWIPYICIMSPILSYIIQFHVSDKLNYSFGHELLLLNGLITFGLLSIVKKKGSLGEKILLGSMGVLSLYVFYEVGIILWDMI